MYRFLLSMATPLTPTESDRVCFCFALNEQVVFLHRRHPGVYKLGNRALDALWGGDEFGAKQKASAEERLRGKDEDDGQ